MRHLGYVPFWLIAHLCFHLIPRLETAIFKFQFAQILLLMLRPCLVQRLNSYRAQNEPALIESFQKGVHGDQVLAQRAVALDGVIPIESDPWRSPLLYSKYITPQTQLSGGASGPVGAR